MVIQKLKLHEWFLVYQLDQIKKTANHLPMFLRLDISRYAELYQAQNQKLPSTAILIKLAVTWAAAYPEVHKMLFRTWFGFQFLKGDEVRINLPIEIKENDQSIITAMVIRNPHLKTVEQINDEIKQAKSKPLSAFPITQFVYSKPNNFIFRSLLKCLHAVVNRFPKFYWKKGGGCLSVSSLANTSKQDCLFSTFSFGPTGFTLFFKDIQKIQNKTYLNLSIAVDHNCYTGLELANLVNQLMILPQHIELNSVSQITQDVHI